MIFATTERKILLKGNSFESAGNKSVLLKSFTAGFDFSLSRDSVFVELGKSGPGDQYRDLDSQPTKMIFFLKRKEKKNPNAIKFGRYPEGYFWSGVGLEA